MNIYIGNLAFDVSEDELKSEFEAYGKVDSAKVITDKYTGESRGFGFIEMQNNSEAQNAMKELDGKEIKGRHIIVNEARPQKDRRKGKGRRGGGNRRF